MSRKRATGPARSGSRWKSRLVAFCLLIAVAAGCSAPQPEPPAVTTTQSDEPDQPQPTVVTTDIGVEEDPGATPAAPAADVISVGVTGEPEAYQFSVGISSPDEGCELYADWWEVLTEDGRLLYRRILTHSHVDEQPFVRSGGPVAIGPDTVVWVRAHMHGAGYGGQAMKGTAQAGFEAAELDPAFAADVESMAPLPAGCAF